MLRVTLHIVRAMILHRNGVYKHRSVCLVDLLNNLIGHFIVRDKAALISRIYEILFTHKAFKA
ncbi:hypothetical protein D3C73_1035040 [compost metagenome]